MAKVIEKKDGAEAQIRRNAQSIKKIVLFLEKVLGADLNGDGKVGAGYQRIGLSIIVTLLFTSMAFGAWRSHYVNSSGTAVVEYEVGADGSYNGNMRLAAGAGTVSADVAGTVVDAGTAITVTNGQAVALSGGKYFVTGVGSADNATNTLTVTVAVGETASLIVSAVSSNLLKIADTGTVYLSGDWIADNNDTIDLYGRSAITDIVQTGGNDN